MDVFWAILGIILVVIIAGAGVLVPIAISVDDDGYFSVPMKITFHVVGLIVAAAVIAIAINLTPPSDNARHCGSGTQYQESSHYDVATKTTQTDWWCSK